MSSSPTPSAAANDFKTAWQEGFAPNNDEDLPILTEIVTDNPGHLALKKTAPSPAQARLATTPASARPTQKKREMVFLQPSVVKIGREINLRLQPSKLNFLAPMQNRQQRRKFERQDGLRLFKNQARGLWPSRLANLTHGGFQHPPPSTLTPPPPPTPPQGETRINAADSYAPTLDDLFPNNHERDQERQILRLAEERAQWKAEQIVKSAISSLQESLWEEIWRNIEKQLPELVAKHLLTQKSALLHNSTTRWLSLWGQGEQESAINTEEMKTRLITRLFHESSPLPAFEAGFFKPTKHDLVSPDHRHPAPILRSAPLRHTAYRAQETKISDDSQLLPTATQSQPTLK